MTAATTHVERPRRAGKKIDTDRELLTLAAKAAGLDLIWCDAFTVPFVAGEPGYWWNPLEDDGQALRLLVTLRMRLQVDDYGSAARFNDASRWWGYETRVRSSEAATRRAIVRAAAELGRAAQ